MRRGLYCRHAGTPWSSSFGLGADAAASVLSAAVRFERVVRYTDGRESFSVWVATMAFRFVEAPMSESERLINPRGFTVMHYRLDEETTR